VKSCGHLLACAEQLRLRLDVTTRSSADPVDLGAQSDLIGAPVSKAEAVMLDYQALWFAADDQAGQRKKERAVPGATWLATMSLGLLRLTGDGRTAQATLWHQLPGAKVMLWPLWRQPLGGQAVQALIEHPAIVPIARPERNQRASDITVRNASWGRLGIMGVYAATRIRAEGQKGQRVLTPISVRVVN
jgi:hypothetical protein